MVASIIVSVCAGIISGMVLFFLQRFIKRHEEAEKEHRKRHRAENILILKSIRALGELTEADSIAIRDGKTNGELKHALSDYTEVSKELDEFLIEQSAQD